MLTILHLYMIYNYVNTHNYKCTAISIQSLTLCANRRSEISLSIDKGSVIRYQILFQEKDFQIFSGAILRGYSHLECKKIDFFPTFLKSLPFQKCSLKISSKL